MLSRLARIARPPYETCGGRDSGSNVTMEKGTHGRHYLSREGGALRDKTLTFMDPNSGKPTAAPRPRLTMALAALGVVYGGPGTSPLYAGRQCFPSPPNGVTPTPESVLGVLSLIFWA